MKQYSFDVIIIGAGPAGVTAAGTLAGSGISVALLEAGVYAGAENWSGCVYFAECLAESDCFGPDLVAAAPFERPVVRRGTLLHNGLDVAGLELTRPAAFKDCYTVLRPIYDPYFAHLARAKGVVHITETTVTSLIRRDRRVIGVQTSRGPLYAGVVFIAEGDASHLIRSERLERVPEPHYLQGVKAVLSLPPREIEKRFRLDPGEGAAYELLIRNASISGRTAKLNAAGFLYTNRDSLSLGYVVPLDNVRNNYRGNHEQLYEWLQGLPYIREHVQGAKLSAYGAKIIRSGGWKERPVLVEDGLAVGGASAGLGVDIPFPNFTGPASATGLFFGRAVKAILKRGGALDAKNLAKEYLAPLSESVYGRNAQHLSKWPAYFGKSRVLFSRTVDLVCGTTHFLASGRYTETGRFLRGHILSYRGLRESTTDTLSLITSLRLWKPLAVAAVNPAILGRWIINIFRQKPAPDPALHIVLWLDGKDVDAKTLPWPAGPLLARLSPSLAAALAEVYANDDRPIKDKLSRAVGSVARGLSLSDFFVLPFFGFLLLLLSLGTALWDAFRFYVLKTPVEKLLAEPVMAYNEAQRKVRDLDSVRPSVALEARLATNTYRVGNTSHIRTLWPEAIPRQSDMSQAGLWWVCPARVYVYDAPLFGRGRVTVNFENCIKCESCWRAEPSRVLWGRHTDHKLVYRPESAAIPLLLDALQKSPSSSAEEQAMNSPAAPGGKPVDTGNGRLWHLSDAVRRDLHAALPAASAFQDAVSKLPASADLSRRAWPLALGKRLCDRLRKIETSLANDGRHAAAELVSADRREIEQRLAEGGIFHALYCCRRFEERTQSWLSHPPAPRFIKREAAISYEEVSAIFPDRIVKEWEEGPMPEAWAETLGSFISERRDAPLDAIRALSTVSPALGLVAAHHLAAYRVQKQAGTAPGFGIAAVHAGELAVHESSDAVQIKGTLSLVPLAGCGSLLIVTRRKGHLVPLATPGVTLSPTPAIGFRGAGLADVTLDCMVRKETVRAPEPATIPDAAAYLAIALGACDYLSRRVKEHALGRIQFPGQMLDTEGRDGIAKLGAVKAMIARIEAWRLLLETLFNAAINPEPGTLIHEPELLFSTIAAMAFSPEPGAMGYDAGQVFGGFAYSEDDLLSRFYRDSSLFRFLAPGYGSAARLNAALSSRKQQTENRPPQIATGPLGMLEARLSELSDTCAGLDAGADPQLAGEALALSLALRLLIVELEKGLNNGESTEAEAASFEVLLSLLDNAVTHAELSVGRGAVSPAALFPIEPSGVASALETDYESFCAAPGPRHRSGGFLTSVFDRSPRFVPEIQLHDPRLRARWSELASWFKKNCRDKSFDGLFVERYIEKLHGLPKELIDAVKQHHWLATYIPKSEDGLGWHKAEYYILNSAAGTFGDAGINLLIMASTSIGTTPVLLGLEDELPRVREELAPLAGDADKLGELGKRLAALTSSFANPEPGRIRKEFETLMKLVDDRIRRTRVVKYLAANFLRAFYSGGMAGKRGDFQGFTTNLRQAQKLFERIMPDVRAALDELPRRERCHRYFLRSLGHGGVSAFALTEPTAGSDSGGVKTTAKLRTAKLTPLTDGRFAFHPDPQDVKNIRYLIDADKVVFAGQETAYQTPDQGAANIKYDRYDYASDQGVRSYEYQGKTCEFHDIGQVRPSEAGPVYEYYLLTGAKMWITNGSIATQFCVYAQTPEGVTGFMVDRHAEGLKVGADEKKTGQRGSPTNELSLDNVRTPREAVIGYEGHGQVNALETLNVGRCGLAVVSGALMHKLLYEALRDIPATPERDLLLGEAAAILFGSESLAFYLIGLFDRPHESVRMESAIAKYACSEDIHELLTLVERAYGPEGQTEKRLVEKARRDSRILTIYEGTNEVQRFLILKDLIAQAADWPELSLPEGDHAAKTLATWKNRLRKHVKDAADLLGDAAWSDAMLQPALFPLAEMAGEILRLECLSYRREWLEARSGVLGPEYAGLLGQAGERAFERTTSRLAHLEARSASAWKRTANNESMPEVRAADAALDRMAEKPARPEPPASLLAPLRILSIVRPAADLSPAPRLAEGTISEFVWLIDPMDHAGLCRALELKARGAGRIVVDALLTGRSGHDELLRREAGGADRLIRLDAEAAHPAALAEAIRALELLAQYDLITIGSAGRDGDQGLGAYLAGALGRTFYRRPRLLVRQDGLGLERLAPPAVVAFTEAGDRVDGDISGIIEAAFARVLVLHPSSRTGEAAAPQFSAPAAIAAAAKTITTVDEAALYLKAFAAQARSAQAEDYHGEMGRGRLADANALWAILDPREQKANGALLCAARQLAGAFSEPLCAIVPAPRESWPALLGLAKANGANRAYCMDTGTGMLSIEGKRVLLRMLLKNTSAPLVCAGTYWTDAFNLVAGEASIQGESVRVFGNIQALDSGGPGTVTISLPAYEGRLIRKEPLDKGPAFLTVLQEAEAGAGEAQADFSALTLDYTLDSEWLMPLPPGTGPVLTQAEVIISLGYGIRDRAGLALAEKLKERLEALGLMPMFGATRKVTQDLKLQPLETQIGQTGVRVNPRLIIALGISGAPQHIDYLGSRAELLCFNKDPDAPLMKLNQTRPAPRVHPLAGDLFVTVRELIEKLA